jgi:phage gpG-like protein
VAFVAAVNNFGSASRNIPARPFMTESAAPALKATAPVAAIMVKAVNRGKATVEQALQEMGPFAVGAFQTTITDTAWVPNAARTVREKQSAKPLIDTGLLRSSLTFVVRKPGA